MKRTVDKISSSAVRRFVRGTLGCSCPDEVFEAVRIVKEPPWFDGLPGDYLLAIGHRLLVCVISTTPWQEVMENLETLFIRGCEMRDAEGFNRFRLVVATPDNRTAEAALMGQFGTLSDRDSRLHLHVVTPECLEELERTND